MVYYRNIHAILYTNPLNVDTLFFVSRRTLIYNNALGNNMMDAYDWRILDQQYPKNRRL